MSNHLMLSHHTKPRESDKFRGFSYSKKLVYKEYSYFLKRKGTSRIIKSQVINWDVMWNGEFLADFRTLKEATDYIREKANT